MNNNYEKKKLIENIDKLTKLEKNEVFNIIKKYNITYTSNSNGIFVDLQYFTEDIVKDLNNYMLFCKNNKKILEYNETKNNDIINIYKNSNTIDLIKNFEEYKNLEDLKFLEKINFNKRKKIENHQKFMNILKKYNRLYLNMNDLDYNMNQLSHDKYNLC
tara:strand:- start:243 stop:722 length:480 start_codon:yes stop_codon:yes gene_type:complete